MNDSENAKIGKASKEEIAEKPLAGANEKLVRPSDISISV